MAIILKEKKARYGLIIDLTHQKSQKMLLYNITYSIQKRRQDGW